GLAVALIDLGELDEAEAILVPLLDTRRRTLPADDQLIAMTARNLGLVALRRGQLDRALVLLREAAEIHRTAAVESLDTAAIAYELGEVHARLQQRDEAIAQHRRALALRRALLGENHAETLASLVVLRSLGIANP
ncbi:MAG TPA: tetratricopeptide repeat protein, partial [Nannocystaceae bacterium]|nr:tetratricopeptide repeat protein [Nannocystaceae bacterium]